MATIHKHLLVLLLIHYLQVFAKPQQRQVGNDFETRIELRPATGFTEQRNQGSTGTSFQSNSFQPAIIPPLPPQPHLPTGLQPPIQSFGPEPILYIPPRPIPVFKPFQFVPPLIPTVYYGPPLIHPQIVGPTFYSYVHPIPPPPPLPIPIHVGPIIK